MPEPMPEPDAGAEWTEDDDVAAVLLAAAVADDDADTARQGQQSDPTGESTVTQPTTDPTGQQPQQQPQAQPAQPANPAPAPAPAPAPVPTPPGNQPAAQQTGQPTFVAPVPPAGQQPPAQQRAAAQNGNAVDPTTGEDLGYPANTPQTEMSADQQIAYWKHKARVHEGRNRAMGDYDELKATAEKYQQLVAASQTDHERAVAEAHRQGRAEALTEAGGQLVEQWVRAAAAGRLSQESVDALLQGLDRSRFLNQNGGVNTDMVYAFVGQLAPAAAPAAAQPAQPAAGQPGNVQQPVPQPPQPLTAPPRVPDFGQGQPQAPQLTGLEAGRAIARARYAKSAQPS